MCTYLEARSQFASGPSIDITPVWVLHCAGNGHAGLLRTWLGQFSLHIRYRWCGWAVEFVIHMFRNRTSLCYQHGRYFDTTCHPGALLPGQKWGERWPTDHFNSFLPIVLPSSFESASCLSAFLCPRLLCLSPTYHDPGVRSLRRLDSNRPL